MLLKKETEYAVLGLIALSKNKNIYMDINALSKKKKLPASLMAKIFQKLAKARIVESKFGPEGGFKLKKNLDHIRLIDVVYTMQGKNVMKCYSGKAIYCSSGSCPFKKLASGIENKIDNYLSQITLKKLITMEEK